MQSLILISLLPPPFSFKIQLIVYRRIIIIDWERPVRIYRTQYSASGVKYKKPSKQLWHTLREEYTKHMQCSQMYAKRYRVLKSALERVAQLEIPSDLLIQAAQTVFDWKCFNVSRFGSQVNLVALCFKLKKK